MSGAICGATPPDVAEFIIGLAEGRTRWLIRATALCKTNPDIG
jgi:hypothetical protein